MALVVLTGLSKQFANPAEWRSYIGASARTFLTRPTLIIEVFIFIIGIIVLGMLMVRSGNVSTGAAPGAEQHFRQVLEDMLWARPRTKEFLFGHPLLMLWLYFWLRLRSLPASPCLPFGRIGAEDVLPILAAIGQASIVDTFAHVHTPIIFSLVRTLHGIWIGVLCGIILIAVWRMIEKIFNFRAQGICVPEYSGRGSSVEGGG
jgi:hypothetical protein